MAQSPSMSGTRYAALMVLARPENPTDEEMTVEIIPGDPKTAIQVPAKHPGGGTIEDMRKAAGWSEGAASGTIPVYRSMGISVLMTKDADGTKRYRAQWDHKALPFVNTGRGQWKNGTRPAQPSSVSDLPGNPGNIAIDAALNAAAEAAKTTVEEAKEQIHEIAGIGEGGKRAEAVDQILDATVEKVTEIVQSVSESEGAEAAEAVAEAIEPQAVDENLVAKVADKRRHRSQEDRRAAK